MPNEELSLYNLWLLTKLLKTKSFTFIMDLIRGKSREVERIETHNTGVISSMYTHLGNLMTLPTFIIDNIYLGNALNASSIETLHKFGIECIINITHDIPSYYPDDINYLNIRVRDTRDSFLESYLDDAFKFIRANANKQILIHCYMGSSRSASIVIYYLMRHHRMDYAEAQSFAKSKRSIVNLNTNFAQELRTLGTRDI